MASAKRAAPTEQPAMNTYSIYVEWKAPTPRHTSYTRLLTAYPDPKRPGLMKMSEQHSSDGYKQKFSFLYGKKNQAEIEHWVTRMEAAA